MPDLVSFNLRILSATDPHFQPLYEYCGFCHVTYDVIGKMETAQNDIRHVLRMTGLNDGLKDPVNPDVCLFPSF